MSPYPVHSLTRTRTKIEYFHDVVTSLINGYDEDAEPKTIIKHGNKKSVVWEEPIFLILLISQANLTRLHK